MQAVELTGYLDEKGFLKIKTPLKVVNQRVKIILLIPEIQEIEEGAWLRAASVNPAFDFLKESSEDVYSVTDGEPVSDEA